MGENTGQPFFKILVVGGGLMGSSVLRAVRMQWGEGIRLCLLDRDSGVRDYCKEHALADDVWGYEDWGGAEGIDLVLLAVPLGAYEEVLIRVMDRLDRGVVVSDVGSSKRTVCRLFEDYLGEGYYGVPGHPVAGTEKAGPGAGMSDLFMNRYCVLTPYKDGQGDEGDGYKGAIERLEYFWEALGMQVEVMTAEHHDLVLAMTSHLPTLIAYCLAGTAKEMENLDWKNQYFADGREVKDNWGEIDSLEVIRYAAGGFRDFTRIAASDPVMWRDIFLHNKSPVLYVLDLFLKDLESLREAVACGEGGILEEWFTRSQKIRSGIIEMGQAGRFTPTEEEGREEQGG